MLIIREAALSRNGSAVELLSRHRLIDASFIQGGADENEHADTAGEKRSC